MDTIHHTKMGVGISLKWEWETHQNAGGNLTTRAHQNAGEKPTGNFIWDSHENFHGNPAISF